ncbi:MAG: biopolymer transporter ExbD [candidate division Zixibacteria bacterium]|nr:biopolymer transporter ExbD [candidate division Zixibacteria bacterium]
MAIVSAGNNQPKMGGQKRGLRRKMRRLPVRIDMTPMVDIAFLLLIFYMVTTVFSQPQAMEMNLPPDHRGPNLKQLLSLRIDGENRYYWNIGRDLPVPMKEDSLNQLLVDKSGQYPRLSIILIINPEADFEALVNVLDEFDLIERSFITIRAGELGVSYADICDPSHERSAEFAKERYSFRYIMAPWDDSDTRRIEKVKSLRL